MRRPYGVRPAVEVCILLQDSENHVIVVCEDDGAKLHSSTSPNKQRHAQDK